MSKSTTSSRLSESDTVSDLYRLDDKIKYKQVWNTMAIIIGIDPGSRMTG